MRSACGAGRYAAAPLCGTLRPRVKFRTKAAFMPTYMDIHELPGVTPEAVAEAHLQDMKVQSKYGVTYHKYWINQRKGKIYCFCEAPSAEAADAVHREA